MISIDLLTKKNKKSKERNIKNEITKFEIKIEVKTTIKNINNSNKVDFKVIQIGEYNVNKQYSQTLDNEKKLIELLTDKLADEILDQISIRLNAIKSFLVENNLEILTKNLNLFYGENNGLINEFKSLIKNKNSKIKLSFLIKYS